MPESTVVQSILGTLGQIGGIGGRRAEDGLTAARSEELAIKNKADKIILQDNEDMRMSADFLSRGYITQKADRSGYEVTPENAARWAEEDGASLAAYMNPEAKNFFQTKGAKGNEPVTLSGVKKLPGGMIPNQNPVDETTGSLLASPSAPASKVPDRYVIELRTQDGRTVPATQNASAAADDALITLTPEALAAKLTGRVSRVHAAGGMASDVADNIMFAELGKMSDDYMRARLAQKGPGEITDDAAASRNLYDILDNTSGEDLDEFARDAGIDPDELRAEAQAKWLKQQEEIRNKVPLNTEDMTAYESTKDLLSQQVERANNALAAFDKMPKPPSGRTGLKATGSVSGRYEKFEKQHTALVKERDAAQAALDKLKPPVMKSPLESGVPMPKFEFTEDKFRESLRGKLDQPTPEQTSALTKYAKDQGVATAQDITKLPERDAQMLMWAIAANARGATPEQKIGIFDKLNNIYRTGDMTKSPIDAKAAIIDSQAKQANAVTNARAVDASISNNESDNYVARARLSFDISKYQTDTVRDFGKDIDAATTEVRKSLDAIYDGTVGADNKFFKTGATLGAMKAWKAIRSDNETLPPGTPKQIATNSAYLEGFFQMAVAQAQVPGAAAWWDGFKHFANFFNREDAMVNMSPIINTARIEYANGKPVRVSFTESANSPKEVEAVVGAAEFERFTGGEDFTTFVNAVHSQQAVNMLKEEGVPATPANIQRAVGDIRKAAGMDK